MHRVAVYQGVKGIFFHLLPLQCDRDVVDYILDIMCKIVNE